MKSFFGLLIALRGLTVGPRSLEPTSRIETIIHRKENEKFVADNKIQAPSPISDTLARLNVFDDEGKLKDDPRRRIWFHQNLSRVAEVLSSPSYTDNLLLAAQWVFDSQTDADPLVRYIRSMVVLEILLGSQKDAPELSIGDLISNRCAYLIAGDFKQRAEITSDFKKIYGIRSQIVHRGKTKLTLEERALLNNLEWMGRRVIQEEIKKIPRPVEDA